MLPSYLDPINRRNFKEKREKGYELLRSCRVCPRKCGVNRLKDERGFCRSGFYPTIASYTLHQGEEPPISGHRGSGTIFFSNCNLRCVFCQNYPISQLGVGREVSVEELSRMMVELQGKGAHNINLVTPSHFVPQIIMALELAVQSGLEIPLVYNTSGYDAVESLDLLAGFCDIYLTDFRYFNPQHALRYSGAEDYPQVVRTAIKEMYRQVGELVLSEEGIALRGLIVRHLILPNGIADTERVMEYIHREISPRVHVSLMGQYFPAYKAFDHEELGRRIFWEEYESAIEVLVRIGIENGWVQEMDTGP